jgi:hypothetical protein
MGFRFQKSFEIVPGIRLNVSKSGLGVSVGPRGAKLSVGPTGTFIHASAVGTGLYYRKKISPNKGRAEGTGTRSRKKLVASESDLRELAKQNGFLLVPDPEKAETAEKEKDVVAYSCSAPHYHWDGSDEAGFTENGICVYCDTRTDEERAAANAKIWLCHYCDEPMKPGKVFAHPSCDWAVENSGAIKFVFLALILGGICWYQGLF